MALVMSTDENGNASMTRVTPEEMDAAIEAHKAVNPRFKRWHDSMGTMLKAHEKGELSNEELSSAIAALQLELDRDFPN